LSPLFPRLIHAYRTQRPKVNISLLELSSSLQIEAIEQRELDVGLLRLPDNAPRTELVFTPLMEEPLLVAMHAGHRLAKATSIKIKDLRGEPFIAYPRAAGVAVSQQILALCAKRGFEPQVVQEAQQASTLIGLTATGLGIALVPATLQTIAVPGVVFRMLDETDTTTTLYIAHRYGDANARAMQFAELALGLR
jgi:DNA-binding transcriptional LysR family regulator